MANSLSNYAENLILNSLFGGSVLTPPNILYFGLSTTTISEAGTGITEPVGNGYSRISINNNSTSFPTTTTSQKSNGVTITFPPSTGNWGEIIDFFISDSLVGGNILCYGTLTIPKTVTSGDILSFAIGNFTITLE